MTKHVLCEISEISPGNCKTVMVEGTRFALYNVGGEFFVTQNHCTHKGAQLVKGELQGTTIQCSQHGWKFDIKTGECLAPGHGRKLRIYPVSIEQSSVVVELEGTEKPQSEVKHSKSVDEPAGKIQFHAVANINDLDDDEVMAVVVGKEEIALYRVDGKFYATHGLCTHEYVSLCDGFVEQGEIECPLHGACFDIKTGKAMSLPAEIDLKVFPVKLEGDTIHIGIEPGPAA